MCGDKEYDQYVLPIKPIDIKATQTHHIRLENNKLYKYNELLNTADLKTCITNFNNFLCTFNNPVLVCHNGKKFVSIILANSIRHLESKLNETICGFVDTLPLFKEVYPGFKSYQLEELITKILKKSYIAHNSLEDVRVLQTLFNLKTISSQVVLKHSFSLSYINKQLAFKSKKNTCISSLQPLKNEKIISVYMAEKIAKSGIHYDHIKLAYARNSLLGIETLFGELCSNGKVRITKDKQVCAKIASYFSK